MKRKVILNVVACCALAAFTCLIVPGRGDAQITPLTTGMWTGVHGYPGWGVQGWHYEPDLADDPANWSGFVAEAFQFAPHGSFFECADEGIVMKYTATIYVEHDIVGHPIPLDVGASCRVFLDGQFVAETAFGFDHTHVGLNLMKGSHVVDLILNNSGNYASNWTLLGVGECLWGTDPAIQFVKAGS